MPIIVTFYGLVSCVAMFKIPVISHVVIFSFIYRALSETTVSTFQAKTDQPNCLNCSSAWISAMRLVLNQTTIKQFKRIEPKSYETIMNWNGQENVPLQHFSQINQNRPFLKGLIANGSRQRKSN